MHTLLDYDGNLPAYVLVSDGKTPDSIPPSRKTNFLTGVLSIFSKMNASS